MDHSKELGYEFIEKLGVTNCYFQPPSSEKMKYPCIRYKFDGMSTIKADNSKYLKKAEYEVIYIHKDPSIDMVEKILDAFQYCRYDRRYSADNLYHDVFTLYYK